MPKQPTRYYFYCSIQTAKAIVLKKTLQFSPASLFNDPFDGSKTPSTIKHGDVPLRDDSVGITCLTSCFRNILMWSHYGENHEGCCFEFIIDPNDPTSIFTEISERNIQFHQVQYRSHLPDNDEPTLKQVTTKASDWDNEEEWRFIWFEFPSTERQYLQFSPNSLVKIFTGAKMPHGQYCDLQNHIRNNWKTRPLPLHKMMLNPMSYELVTQEILKQQNGY